MTEQTKYLTSADVMTRYQISDTTLARWIKDEEIGFPVPMTIKRRRFFNPVQLEAWERSRLEVAA